MRVLIDENMSSRRLAARLQSVGHDVRLASDVGLGSVSDARVLAWAVTDKADLPVMTRPDSIHATAAASTTPGSRDKLETKGETIA